MARLTGEDGIDGPFERAMSARPKRKRRTAPPHGVPTTADHEWSDPGSTFGIPDRWQIRTVTLDVRVTAGDNRRKSRTEFQRPATETPWHVFERQPDPQTNGTSTKLVEVASGIETSQEAARDAADRAAAEYIARKAVAP